MRITLTFALDYWWVGVFIDRPKRRVCICLLPCVLLTIYYV